MIKVTYLYHPLDATTYEALRKYVVGLERDGLIEELLESRAGAHVQEHMKLRMEEAQVIILLISSNFDAEDSYSNQEIVDHINKCAEKGAYIWPIMVRPIMWERSRFQAHPVFFGRDKAVIEYQPIDGAYKRIAEQINREITQMISEAWTQDGDRYYHQMHLAEAFFAYEQSLRHTPGYLPALLGKVRVYCKQGKHEEAEQSFDTLLSYETKAQRKGKDTTNTGSLREDCTHACCKGYALLALGRVHEAYIAFREVYQQLTSPVNDMQRKICAEAYGGAGDALLMLGHQTSDFRTYYGQALTAYCRAKEIHKEPPRYLAGIGETYLAWGSRLPSKNCHEKALETYQQVLDRCPDYAPAYVGQGKALWRLGRLEEALAAYDRALQFDPYETHAYGGKGYVLLALNNPREALSAFEKAVLLEHDNAHYHYSMGRAQALQGFHQEALHAYNKARDWGFKSAVLIVHYAATLLELGDEEYVSGQPAVANLYYEDALSSYNQAVEQRGHELDDVICSGLGRICFAQRDWEGALQYFQKAIGIAPFKADAYLGAGKTLIELGKYQEALASFKNARLRCDHAESMIDLADVETAYGDAYRRIAEMSDSEDHFFSQKEARMYYERAIGIRKHAMAYVGLGKTYAALHYHKEAIDALDRALQLKPRLVECYFLKGKCYSELEQPSAAYDMYETAIASGFDNASVQNALGNVLLVMRRYEQALSIFEMVTKHAGEETADAYCGKGVALHALGMNEAALQAFESANRLDPLICSQSRYRRTLQDLCSFFEKTLRNHTQEASAYKHKGDVLLLLEERMEDAIGAYRKAREYGDRSAELYCRRGEAYERQEKYRRALKDYVQALKIDPDHHCAQEGKERVEQRRESFLKRLTSWLFTH